MEENEKKYNANDFARYHSGTMPPDEMHALEKAALEDPFLSDALEGYMYSKDAVKEVDEISMHLNERKKEKNIFSMSSFAHNTWWKIAAMIVVIAGAAYFFFTNNSQKESSLAIKQDTNKAEHPAIIPEIKNDTNTSEGNIAFENTEKEKDNNNPQKLSSPAEKFIQKTHVKRSTEEGNRIIKEKNIPEENIVDKQEKNIALIKDKTRESNLTLNDSGEKSLFLSSDTNALAAVSPKGYFKDSANQVAMNKEAPSLNEVVVTGYGSQKKKSITRSVSDKLEGKVSGIEVSSNLPYPKGGKEKFVQYIKDNAVAVLDSTGKKIPANILLSFILNKRGKPTHIKVIESSCKPCEKEATRLLKTGPDWIGKSGDAGNVRIQF